MAALNGTRRAPRARSRKSTGAFADYFPEQISFFAGVPHLEGDGITAIRRFARSAYGACRAARPRADAISERVHRNELYEPNAPLVAYEHYTPILYAHDGSGFRVASPEQVLVQAQLLVERQFHRGGPIVNRPDTVRAMLQLKLSAHPHSVFACFFLTKRYELIDYVELFNGTTDNVVVHLREVMRAALKRHAEGVICARNDPTGEGAPTTNDKAIATKLRWLLEQADMHLLDYLIVGRTIQSLAERGNL